MAVRAVKKAKPKVVARRVVAKKAAAVVKKARAVSVAKAVKAPSQAKRWSFGFTGQGSDLFVLWLVNQLLGLITLGIYRGWAKAKEYRFEYGNTVFDGRPFEFHGLGKEIFVGYLVAGIFLFALYLLAVMSLVVGAVVTVPLVKLLGIKGLALGVLVVLLTLVAGLAALMLVGWVVEQAHFRSRKFRARRISYNGVRFGLQGQPAGFVRQMLLWRLKTLATGFVLYPYYLHHRNEQIYSRLFFGSLPFEYDGDAREFFGLWWRGALLTLLTLGIYGLWWTPALQRYVYSHIKLGPDRLTLDMSNGDYIRLQLGNLLLVVFTLGIGAAWAKVRTARFYAQHLSLQGTLDPATAVASAGEDTSASGAGMEALMDMDLDWGF